MMDYEMGAGRGNPNDFWQPLAPQDQFGYFSDPSRGIGGDIGYSPQEAQRQQDLNVGTYGVSGGISDPFGSGGIGGGGGGSFGPSYDLGAMLQAMQAALGGGGGGMGAGMTAPGGMLGDPMAAFGAPTPSGGMLGGDMGGGGDQFGGMFGQPGGLPQAGMLGGAMGAGGMAGGQQFPGQQGFNQGQRENSLAGLMQMLSRGGATGPNSITPAPSMQDNLQLLMMRLLGMAPGGMTGQRYGGQQTAQRPGMGGRAAQARGVGL